MFQTKENCIEVAVIFLDCILSFKDTNLTLNCKKHGVNTLRLRRVIESSYTLQNSSSI